MWRGVHRRGRIMRKFYALALGRWMRPLKFVNGEPTGVSGLDPLLVAAEKGADEGSPANKAHQDVGPQTAQVADPLTEMIDADR